jgi:hypothetical protein
MIAGFDIGMQTNQMTKNTRKWTASAIMLRYQLSKKWKMCFPQFPSLILASNKI